MNYPVVTAVWGTMALACVLQACRSSADTAASPEERAAIVGTLNDTKGNRFTERVMAVVTQGTSTRNATVEKGEFRFEGLLPDVDCSLAFTSVRGDVLSKTDVMRLDRGENIVVYTVEKAPRGKFRFIPTSKPLWGGEDGPRP